MIKVKICGITNLEDAIMASRFGADAVGFIFYPASPRSIKVEAAKRIMRRLDPFVLTVGVFVDEKKERVLEIARDTGVKALQFHGKESASYCSFFRPRFSVIKTLFPHDSPLGLAVKRYSVDAFLCDVLYKDKLKGQRRLSDSMMKEVRELIRQNRRIIISGGLNDKNLMPALKLNPYGVDVASGLEKLVGKKDEQAMDMFIKKAKGKSNAF